MERTTLQSFKEEALKREGVKQIYEDLSAEYEVRKQLIALRQQAGFTQEQIAEILQTKKSNISRLESVNSLSSPRLSTLSDYAAAMGYKLKIEFVRNGEVCP
ncbi:MAG: helix-turn-helix transcriptional regulator [Pseudohongiella sp.]|nr:helix-turn-helix transcriptional regulator [Pseudohongiella sp.]